MNEAERLAYIWEQCCGYETDPEQWLLESAGPEGANAEDLWDYVKMFADMMYPMLLNNANDYKEKEEEFERLGIEGPYGLALSLYDYMRNWWDACESAQLNS